MQALGVYVHSRNTCIFCERLLLFASSLLRRARALKIKDLFVQRLTRSLGSIEQGPGVESAAREHQRLELIVQHF